MTAIDELRLGFVALTDAAPLIVADALGYFAHEGLSVGLVREASWATVRDRLAAGLLDGAHLLAPIALAARVGAGGPSADLIAPLALNAHGAAFAVSTALLEAGCGEGSAPPAQQFAAALQARRFGGEPPPRLGVVFSYSIHVYMLKAWLEAQGVDPERDVTLVVLPPTAMVEGLRSGAIQGACVGAPWGAVIEAEGLGRIVFRASRLAPLGPDKVFAVGEGWAERNPAILAALLRALARAGAWADDARNRTPLIEMLTEPGRVGADPAALLADLAPNVSADRIRFSSDDVARPRLEHARALLEEMRRWGQLDEATDIEAAARAVYRPDLLAKALSA